MHVLKSRFVHIRYECLFGEMCERETKLRSLSLRNCRFCIAARQVLASFFVLLLWTELYMMNRCIYTFVTFCIGISFSIGDL